MTNLPVDLEQRVVPGLDSSKYVSEAEQWIEDSVKKYWTASKQFGCAPFIIPPNIFSLVPGFALGKTAIHANRQYYRVDFNDFLDFATSDLPKGGEDLSIPDDRLLCFDPFPGGLNELAFDLPESNLYVASVGLSRHRGHVGVLVMFISQNKLKPEELRNDGVVLQISQPGKVETARSRFFYNFETHNYEFMTSGVFINHLLDTYAAEPAKYGNDIEKMKAYVELVRLWEAPPILYEIARLTLLLPSYVEFMYDLIVTDRKSFKIPSTVHGRGSTKRRKKAHKIYKIIKSIRVTYVHPEKVTNQSRQWSPPSYRFRVRGHWRIFRERPGMLGHDAQGTPVVGRTWVSEFEKGFDRNLAEEVDLEAKPNTTIYVKQTLQYARDVLRARDLAHTQSEASSSRPTKEWIYEERTKLTAGLRFTILRRDGYRCRICGRGSEDGVKLHVDHIVPLVKWGRTVENNLQTTCSECNLGKARNPKNS